MSFRALFIGQNLSHCHCLLPPIGWLPALCENSVAKMSSRVTHITSIKNTLCHYKGIVHKFVVVKHSSLCWVHLMLPTDVVSGNLKVILALCHSLRLHFEGSSPKRELRALHSARMHPFPSPYLIWCNSYALFALPPLLAYPFIFSTPLTIESFLLFFLSSLACSRQSWQLIPYACSSHSCL